MNRDRGGLKWDRAARYLKVAMILHAHPEGISAQQIADQIGVSKRTAYRDLQAMDNDAELPIWQDKGRWGLEAGAFLPPLNLTTHEAMALFLAARVLAKASDELDSELIAAFLKLGGVLPGVLGEHVQSTIDAFAATRTVDEHFTRVLRTLTEAWAGRRVVEIVYGAGVYDPTKEIRRARVRPYLDRALRPDPCALPHRLGRGAAGAADLQGRAHPGGRADAGHVRAGRRLGPRLGHARRLGRHRRPTHRGHRGALLADRRATRGGDDLASQPAARMA